MRIDLYTKTILTGIFGCLVWLCVTAGPVGTPVQAQLGPTPVIVAGYQTGGTVKALDGGLPVIVLQAGSALMPAAATPGAPAVALPLASPPRSTAPAQVSTRCQATTQKGTQCSRNAKTGSRYCWQHGG
jgi:hypothetical protein